MLMSIMLQVNRIFRYENFSCLFVVAKSQNQIFLHSHQLTIMAGEVGELDNSGHWHAGLAMFRCGGWALKL